MIVNDKLSLAKMNSLPYPLTAVFVGGDEWQVESIDAETGLMRILVSGMLEVREFAELRSLKDVEGNEHVADLFYTDDIERLVGVAVGEKCRGCGERLLPENTWMEDGCPCNSPRGVNQRSK